MKFGCDSCDHCGLCCKVWDIELSKEDIRNLVNLGYDLRDFLVLEPVPRIKMVGKEKNCIFLDEENMCILEKKHGKHAKPHTCRHYPDIKPEKLKENDYFFYEYGGRVFTRDLMNRMLENLKRTSKPYLFEMLLEELETLRKQKEKYVDIFNYDDTKKPSGFRKSLMKRRVKKIISKKFREDDRKEFETIEKRKRLNIQKLIEEIQKRIPGSDAVNPNLPEMLLAYFYLLQESEPRDPKRLAEYFFEWNAKRF